MNIQYTVSLILGFLLAVNASAQIVESRRNAANSLWETYGRNANNPTQMPATVPDNPGNNVDQIEVAPNYNALKNGLTSLINNNGGILRFTNNGPATIQFNEVMQLVPPFATKEKVRTVVIQGKNITFDGGNSSSIFLVRGRIQFVVQDATFANANFQGQSMDNLRNTFRTGGGAIEMSQSGPLHSALRVRNCQFLNNRVSHFRGIGENQNGAAIRFNYGSSGQVFGCTFNNNRAVTGAAIGATSIQKLIVIDSDFDSNLSDGYKSTTGFMNVVEGAAAIRVDRSVNPVEVYGSKFTRNSANVKVSVMEVFAAPVSGFTPGMPSNESTLVIDGCEFSNNKYNNYAGVSNFERAFFAGCLVFHGNDAEVKISNTVFNNNDVGQANIRFINNFNVSRCIFANTNFLTTSDAPQQGAVFLQKVPQSGSFDRCTFYNNEPRNGARANDIMFWQNNVPSVVTLNNSIFYRANTNTGINQVHKPLRGSGNNQFIPGANMSSVAEVTTTNSNKTDPNINARSITDMCLGANSLPADIGGLPDCDSVSTPPSGGDTGGGNTGGGDTGGGNTGGGNTGGGNTGGDNLGSSIAGTSFDAESHPTNKNNIRVVSGVVGYIRNDNWVRFDAFNFGAGASSVEVRASTGSGTRGQIQFRLGSPTGSLIATVDVTGTTDWSTYEAFSANVSGATGVQDLYLVFKAVNGSGTYLLNVQNFTFTGGNTGGDTGGNTGGGNTGGDTGGNTGGSTPGMVNATPSDDARLQHVATGPYYKSDNAVLQVENWGRIRESFLKFNVTGVNGTVSGAKLRLVSGAAGSGTLNVYLGSSNNWTEDNLSQGNAPARGALLGSLNGGFTAGSVHEIDLSGITGNGVISLILTNTPSAGTLEFSSKEGANAPVLEVAFQ